MEQVLESLLQGAAAAVRPVTKEELRDAADGDSDDRALPLRQAAEALLVVGDAVNSAEFRQRHGDRWVPLMLALDARFSRVMATCPEADAGLWDGDQSTLMSSVSERRAMLSLRRCCMAADPVLACLHLRKAHPKPAHAPPPLAGCSSTGGPAMWRCVWMPAWAAAAGWPRWESWISCWPFWGALAEPRR